MASEIVERQKEAQEFTFDGVAIDEIRRGLVFGLYLAAEVDRVRGEAESDEIIGKPWRAGTIPKRPGESMFSDIANALLWLEVVEPDSATTGEDPA